MPPRTFTQNERTILDSASSDVILDQFDALHVNLAKQSFLSPKNYLREKPVQIIEGECGKRPRNRKKRLAKFGMEYIASSAILHSFDGWAYFSNAVIAAINGDLFRSRHLLYYSELRGVMGILAANGIGVFNSRHVVIDRQKQLVFVNQRNGRNPNKIGTHNFTWEAIEHWFSLDKNKKSLLDSLSVDGISFNDWLNAFGLGANHKYQIVSDLISKLTLDLKTFSNDRESRNEVSYRPTNLLNVEQLDFLEILQNVKEVWELCEPVSDGKEYKVDLYLLREILQNSFRQTHPKRKTFRSARAQYRSKLSNMFGNLPLSDQRKAALSNFFLQDNQEFFRLLSVSNSHNKKFAAAILCRAFLLLRISSLFVNKVVSNSKNIDKIVTSFWWKQMGKQLGLWDENEEPDDFLDLWEDFNMIKDDLEEILQTRISPYDFLKRHSNIIFSLGAFSKTGLWSSGL